MSTELSGEKSETCKPFAYTEELCKGCDRKYYTPYESEKWFCFGITTFENRKKHGIPEFDNLRVCVRHPSKLPELSVKGLFLLNLSEGNVKELVRGLNRLLKAFV